MTIDRVSLLERIFSVTRSLSGSVNLEAYLQSILSSAANFTGIESASLLNKKVLASHDQARELEELQNEFITKPSHELRTPLGLILGYSTFYRELIGEDLRAQVEEIVPIAFKLKEIIENLSRVDNYETGGSLVRSRRVSISRIIQDV